MGCAFFFDELSSNLLVLGEVSLTPEWPLRLFITKFLSNFTLGERLLISWFLIVTFFFLGLGKPVLLTFLFFFGPDEVELKLSTETESESLSSSSMILAEIACFFFFPCFGPGFPPRFLPGSFSDSTSLSGSASKPGKSSLYMMIRLGFGASSAAFTGTSVFFAFGFSGSGTSSFTALALANLAPFFFFLSASSTSLSGRTSKPGRSSL